MRCASGGHDAVAPDLPTDRDDATWQDCVDVVGGRRGRCGRPGGGRPLGSGGFVVPLAADRLRAALQVYVAGDGAAAGRERDRLVRGRRLARGGGRGRPGRDGGLTGSADPRVAFHHDVPAALARPGRGEGATDQRAACARPRGRCAGPCRTSRRGCVVTTQDRFLPPALQRRVAADRLGVVRPDDLAAGHCAALSRPEALADLLAEAARTGGR